MSVKILKSCILAVVVIIAAILGTSSCGRNGKMTSITVLPENVSIIPGTSQQFQAQGLLSDGTTFFLSLVDWSLSSSAATTIATIDPVNGLLLASTTTGTVMITAADPYSTFTGTTSLTVDLLSSITVTPTSPSMTPGLTHQFTATGLLANAATQDLTTFVTWTSLNPAVATVLSTPGIAGTGIVTSVATGTAIIQATDLTSGITGTTTLIVTPVPLASLAMDAADLNLTLSSATIHQYHVTGTYSDSAQQPPRDWTLSAIWSSSNIAVATIDVNGLAAPVAAGTTAITATDPITGIAISTALTVTTP